MSEEMGIGGVADIKAKLNAFLALALLHALGALKSWTMWVNAAVLALPQLLPQIGDSLPQIQPYIPANLYAHIAFWLPIINLLLRIKTNGSLASKMASPLAPLSDVGKQTLIMFGAFVIMFGLVVQSAHAAVDYTLQPVRRSADGSIYRSSAAVSAFRTATVCPATGAKSKACAGYIVDHVWPLKCARNEQERRLFDVPGNMQYQTVSDSLAKDRTEGAGCKGGA